MDREECIAVSSEFEKQYEAYYRGESISEDVTQGFWYSMFLEKRRLDKLGLSLDIRIRDKNIDDASNPQNRPVVDMLAGKNSKAAIVSTRTSVKRVYTRGYVRLAKKIDYNAKSYCSFLEKKTKDVEDASNLEVVCPKCGAIQNRENLIDGCDYCNTAYKITDSSSKVSAFHVFHDAMAEANQILSNMEKLRIICVLALFLIVFGTMWTMSNDTYLYANVLKKVFIIVGEIAFVLVIVYSRMVRYLYHHRIDKYAKSEGRTLLENNCDSFNMGEFVENLDYKIKLIHFSESTSDLYFNSSNLDFIIADYSNVVNCEVRTAQIAQYRADESYHYVDVEAECVVNSLVNDRIVENIEIINISLKKSRQEYISNSIVSYSCNKCGSSVNLLDGAKCPHCGEYTDISLYDWVITDYKTRMQSLNENKEKKAKRNMLVIVGVILLLNIANVISALSGLVGVIRKPTTRVYAFGNDYVESVESYYNMSSIPSISVVRESIGTKKLKEYSSYCRERIDNTDYFNEYIDYLVNKDGFELVSKTENKFVLKRNKRAGFGKFYLTIEITGSPKIIVIISN